ncbi:hypothetical protein [Blastococcus deserti]|uniref:Flagellar protein FlgN n=1 Tax=Blastococcus deserti TaxID=2259033 RepID=A0ABW4XEH1_9ACTN
MTSSDPLAEGARRADRFLTLLSTDEAAAHDLLDGMAEVRDLVYLGAGLTAVARNEAHTLPPAQRAQANTRQLRLGMLRDANRDDPDGLRTWLRRSGEEILLIRSQQAIANRVGAEARERTARRVADEALGGAGDGATGSLVRSPRPTS